MEAVFDAEDILGMMFGGMAGVYVGLFLAVAMGDTRDWLDLFLWGDQGYVVGSTSGGLVGGGLRLWGWIHGRRRAQAANEPLFALARSLEE